MKSSAVLGWGWPKALLAVLLTPAASQMLIQCCAGAVCLNALGSSVGLLGDT